MTVVASRKPSLFRQGFRPFLPSFFASPFEEASREVLMKKDYHFDPAKPWLFPAEYVSVLSAHQMDQPSLFISTDRSGEGLSCNCLLAADKSRLLVICGVMSLRKERKNTAKKRLSGILFKPSIQSIPYPSCRIFHCGSWLPPACSPPKRTVSVWPWPD